jgi:hydrogenase expression/formation protein HypC
MCLGVPGKIVATEEGLMRMGTVDFDGSQMEICLAYVPEAKEGDYVLVHPGFALTMLDEEEAGKTLALLRELGEPPEPPASGGG